MYVIYDKNKGEYIPNTVSGYESASKILGVSYINAMNGNKDINKPTDDVLKNKGYEVKKVSESEGVKIQERGLL